LLLYLFLAFVTTMISVAV